MPNDSITFTAEFEPITYYASFMVDGEEIEKDCDLSWLEWDGSALIEESEPYFGFTLRFWKIREGQGPNIRVEEYDEPAMILLAEKGD